MKNGWYTIEDVKLFTHNIHIAPAPGFFIDKNGNVVGPQNKTPYEETHFATLKTYGPLKLDELKQLVLGARVYMYDIEDRLHNDPLAHPGQNGMLRAYIERI